MIRAYVQLRLAIWNLSTGNASYVQYPKSSSSGFCPCSPTWVRLMKGHSYSSDSRYLAIAEKHSSKDYIGVYDSQAGYSLLRVGRLKIGLILALSHRYKRLPRPDMVSLWSLHCRLRIYLECKLQPTCIRSLISSTLYTFTLPLVLYSTLSTHRHLRSPLRRRSKIQAWV